MNTNIVAHDATQKVWGYYVVWSTFKPFKAAATCITFVSIVYQTCIDLVSIVYQTSIHPSTSHLPFVSH